MTVTMHVAMVHIFYLVTYVHVSIILFSDFVLLDLMFSYNYALLQATIYIS